VLASEQLMGDLALQQRSDLREVNAAALDHEDTSSPSRPEPAKAKHPFDVSLDDFHEAPPFAASIRTGRTSVEALDNNILVQDALAKVGAAGSYQIINPDEIGATLQDVVWRRPEGTVDLTWDFVPELGCYAMAARHTPSNSIPDEGALGQLGSYYESVESGTVTQRRLDRIILPMEASDEGQQEAMVRFLEYVRLPTVKPSSDRQRLELVARFLDALPDVNVERVILPNGPAHRLSVRLETLTGRSQTVHAYVYDEMVLISSRVRALDDAFVGRYRTKKLPGQLGLQRFVAEQNSRYRVGYLTLHQNSSQGPALCYCERLFQWPLALDTLRRLVVNLALHADAMEVRLGNGKDDE